MLTKLRGLFVTIWRCICCCCCSAGLNIIWLSLPIGFKFETCGPIFAWPTIFRWLLKLACCCWCFMNRCVGFWFIWFIWFIWFGLLMFLLFWPNCCRCCILNCCWLLNWWCDWIEPIAEGWPGGIRGAITTSPWSYGQSSAAVQKPFSSKSLQRAFFELVSKPWSSARRGDLDRDLEYGDRLRDRLTGEGDDEEDEDERDIPWVLFRLRFFLRLPWLLLVRCGLFELDTSISW